MSQVNTWHLVSSWFKVIPQKKKSNWTICLKLSLIVLYQCLPVLALIMRVMSSVHYDIAGSKGFLRNTWKKLEIENLVLRTIWYIICEKSCSFKQHQLKMFLKCLPSRSWLVSFWIRCFVHAFRFIFFPFHELFWNFFKLKGDDLYTKSMQ